MEFDEIRTFVAVAESGSIIRAARTLNLSQPAVTRQVQRLEAALDLPLLDRRTKPLILTPAGRAVLERCRLVLAAVEALRGATVGGEPAGELRIGVAPSLAEVALTNPVDHLRRSFPRVSLRLSAGWSRALLEQVRTGLLDAAVVHLPDGDRPPAGVGGRRVGRERAVLVAARGGPDGIRTLTNLADASWVLNPEGCGLRSSLRHSLQRINAPLRVAVEAHGLDLQLSLVARGIGLGLVPERALARARLRSRLRIVRVRGQGFRLAIWSVRGRPAASVAPALAAFDEALVRTLEGGRRAARPRPADGKVTT